MNNPRSQRPQPQGNTAFPGGPFAKRHATPGITTSGHEAAASAGSFVQGEALFLASLPVIDDVTGQVCRRHRLSRAEADDFRSDVRLHFIERNYDVLARFEGRSSLPTYVTVVIQRLYLDFRNRQWGKWRPSAEAKRLGPAAMLVERLALRDGWTFEQLSATLRINHGIAMDEELEGFYQRLVARAPGQQLVPEDEAGQIEGTGPAPDANVVRAEQDFLVKRVQSALDRARDALDPEERLILKMRFEGAVPVADIARAMHLDQKRLYRTIERLLARLGDSLAAEGISRSDVRALFAEGVLSWDRNQRPAGLTETRPAMRPAEPARTSWLAKR
jgi:RNA polymerase sigma factor (sigma-70 family)